MTWKLLFRMPFQSSEDESIKIYFQSNCGKVTALRQPATEKKKKEKYMYKNKGWDEDFNAFQQLHNRKAAGLAGPTMTDTLTCTFLGITRTCLKRLSAPTVQGMCIKHPSLKPPRHTG